MQSVEVLSSNDVISSLWSKNAPEKCRLGLTDTVLHIPFSIDHIHFFSRFYMKEVFPHDGM
jgi:hypothetical protein